MEAYQAGTTFRDLSNSLMSPQIFEENGSRTHFELWSNWFRLMDGLLLCIVKKIP